MQGLYETDKVVVLPSESFTSKLSNPEGNLKSPEIE